MGRDIVDEVVSGTPESGRVGIEGVRLCFIATSPSCIGTDAGRSFKALLRSDLWALLILRKPFEQESVVLESISNLYVAVECNPTVKRLKTQTVARACRCRRI